LAVKNIAFRVQYDMTSHWYMHAVETGKVSSLWLAVCIVHSTNRHAGLALTWKSGKSLGIFLTVG